MDDPKLSVESLDCAASDSVAEILAAAYTDDPVHIWAMPKEATRLSDAVLFFKSYFKLMPLCNQEFMVTSDRSAAAIIYLIRQSNNPDCKGVRNFPPMLGKLSKMNGYLQWIEGFRPKVDHYYIEFIGCLPGKRSQGRGSFILKNILAKTDRENIPVWTWSSNPLNLSFYRRLGFEIGRQFRYSEDTPPITPVWRPAAVQGEKNDE
jgi:ribosomal protein S18 acetylase RimI-like enzyme